MTNDRWQIHRHLAEQADQRLQIVKTVPRRILLAGADGDNSRRLLAARYPKAAFAEYDPRPECLRDAADKRGGGLLSKLAGKTVPQHCQALSAPLPEASADMLWSNLGLATEHNPVAVFASWAGALQTDGLRFLAGNRGLAAAGLGAARAGGEQEGAQGGQGGTAGVFFHAFSFEFCFAGIACSCFASLKPRFQTD